MSAQRVNSSAGKRTGSAPARPPVTAIGASAGGLAACRKLLSAIAPDSGMAFLLVQHLDPDHESMMVELLARDIRLDVCEAADGMSILPNRVHVIPPGSFLTVERNVLRLHPPESEQGVRLSFDVLLRSLAREYGDQAACVVLSGNGSDGSSGLKDIHDRGGRIFVQSPDEAEHPGMPEAAIATGLADAILDAARIPAALLHRIEKKPATSPARSDRDAKPSASNVVDKIVDLVRVNAIRDLTLYKTGTIERRIQHRMALAGLIPDEMPLYLVMLQDDPDEIDRLAADLLIHVTSFFRDASVFDYLINSTLPGLLRACAPDRPLRIWVAGCSTGEEAYSIAIAAMEVRDRLGLEVGIQILASDIDAGAVATAREGIYPDDIAQVVSAERLARYFVAEDTGWRVAAPVRDLIVFTVHDLLSDPPFSRIDLISCRNVLIYMTPEAQRRVIGLCSFALNSNGLLLLGSAETPGSLSTRFEVVDKTAHVWRSIGKPPAGELLLMSSGVPGGGKAFNAPAGRPAKYGEICRRLVIENFAPAAVLLNRRLECLYLLGPTQRYLKLAPGSPNHDLLAMVAPGLRIRLKAAAAECTRASPHVSVEGGEQRDGTGFAIELRFVDAGDEELLFACFVDRVQKPDRSGSSVQIGDDDAAGDLAAVRAQLAVALRDLERSVEDRTAEAAEAMSVNEEYLSTNEELLASKEELQSLNEELMALNSQLQETLERHRTTANDLQNILFSTNVATLFLDTSLNIRFFTPATRSVFRVIASDIGRPLSDLAALASDDALQDDAQTVLKGGEPVDREVSGPDGMCLTRRVQPYNTENGSIEGVVITYTDITESKRTRQALEEARSKAELADATKSRFLAAASHDLRQPLQSLALLHDLISSGEAISIADYELPVLLDRTLASMTVMLDTLLDVNRIDAGAIKPTLRPVRLGPLMERLAAEFGHSARQRGLHMRVVPCQLNVMTDPVMLEQIIRNLLSNAIKYTNEGGVLLGCRRKGEKVSLEVWDSGIGLTAKDHAAIFSAYFQVEQPVSEKPATGSKGLGLGLAIVQRFSLLLDCPVTVRSQLGTGSAFAIELPLTLENADELPAQFETISIDPMGAPAQILLVEDEHDLRKLLGALMVRDGYSVIVAADAEEAFSRISVLGLMPDLVLTDYDLVSGPNGLELATTLCDLAGEPIPTIVLTGDITTEALRDIEKSGFAHLSKPVTARGLRAQINRLLVRSESRDSPAGINPDSKPGEATQARAELVHIIDDDADVLERLATALEQRAFDIRTYRSAEEFLAADRPEGPSCLVLDAYLPGMDGLSLLRHLKEEGSALPVIMITGQGDTALAVAATKAGAVDFLEKPVSALRLLSSIKRSLSATKESGTKARLQQNAVDRINQLSAREAEVMTLIIDGKPNKVIAYDLGISQRTVENHRAAIMRKTETKTLASLLQLAHAAGIA